MRALLLAALATGCTADVSYLSGTYKEALAGCAGAGGQLSDIRRAQPFRLEAIEGRLDDAVGLGDAVRAFKMGGGSRPVVVFPAVRIGGAAAVCAVTGLVQTINDDVDGQLEFVRWLNAPNHRYECVRD